ncbi:MAG: hypothetical protein V1808_03475 [Candidatus Daviesbacteria bacterium]
MNWTEIEKIASAYEKELQEREIKASQRAIKAAAAKRAKLSSMAPEILANIHAQEALEAFRDDVWHEGNIEPNPLGFKLISEPYRLLQVQDHPLSIKVSPELYSNLSVSLTLGEDKLGNKIPSIRVRQNKRYFAYERENTIAYYLKEESILWRGSLYRRFESAINSNYFEIKDFDAKVPAQAKESEQMFYSALNRLKSDQDNYCCSPSQIRNVTQALIDQLPVTLKETDKIGGVELKHWAHQATGSRLALFYDRIIRRQK